MRAFERSYGDISTFTVSPSAILIQFLRIFPDICASTSCPLGNFTLNIVPGITCEMVPSNCMGSSFGIRKSRTLAFGPQVGKRKGEQIFSEELGC